MIVGFAKRSGEIELNITAKGLECKDIRFKPYGKQKLIDYIFGKGPQVNISYEMPEVQTKNDTPKK